MQNASFLKTAPFCKTVILLILLNPFNHVQPFSYNLMLSSIPDDYLPRTNYVPACSPEEYQRRTPRVPWGENEPVTKYYRLFARRQLSQSGERTLIPVIMPPGVAHIHPVISTTFKDNNILILFAASCASILFDFFIKTTGKGDLYESTLRLLPIVGSNKFQRSRILCLSSLTIHYTELWKKSWDDSFNDDLWTKSDPRLAQDYYKNLTREWNRHCGLITPYERRQALLELDVLLSIGMNLTLEELKTIYRIQFPVLQAYEKETFYDQKGQIVFTTNRGLTDVGLSRGEWKEVEHLKSGSIEKRVIVNTLPTGPLERTITYHAPFDKCDREKDYETAWKEFEKRLV